MRKGRGITTTGKLGASAKHVDFLLPTPLAR